MCGWGPGGASIALLSRGLAGSAVLTAPSQQAPGRPRTPLSPHVTLFDLQSCPRWALPPSASTPATRAQGPSSQSWSRTAGQRCFPRRLGGGPFQLLGVPALKTAWTPLPGEAGLGRWRRGTVRCLHLGPPSSLGVSLLGPPSALDVSRWDHPPPSASPWRGGAYLSLLSVVSSRASSAPGGWGEVGTVPGRVGVWRQGQRPRAGWLLALRTRSGPAVARVLRGSDIDDLMSAWWRQRLG